jgi:hypothetical protein
VLNEQLQNFRWLTKCTQDDALFGYPASPGQQSHEYIVVPRATSPATGHLVGLNLHTQPSGPYMTAPEPRYEQGHATSRPFGSTDQHTYPQFNSGLNGFMGEEATGGISAISVAATVPNTPFFWHNAYFGHS